MRAYHPLLKTAKSQAGLFTARQAIESGIDSRNHSYHLKTGNWSRMKRGIYRLNVIQETAKTDFFLFQLWSTTRKGKPAGVFSHKTALYLLGLELALPVKFHLTVPVGFRRNTPVSDKLILHYEDLNMQNKIIKNNILITGIEKTFQDLISSGLYSPEWIKQKFKTAIAKKVISLEEIKKIPIQKEIKRTFSAIVFELS